MGVRSALGYQLERVQLLGTASDGSPIKGATKDSSCPKCEGRDAYACNECFGVGRVANMHVNETRSVSVDSTVDRMDREACDRVALASLSEMDRAVYLMHERQQLEPCFPIVAVGDMQRMQRDGYEFHRNVPTQERKNADGSTTEIECIQMHGKSKSVNYPRIAEALGLSERQVRRALQRANRTIRRHQQEWYR